jgi:hypothetical protein
VLRDIKLCQLQQPHIAETEQNKTKKLLKYVFFANEIVCPQSDSNTEPLNQDASEQQVTEK